MYTVSSAPDLSSRLGPSQAGELGGGAKASARAGTAVSAFGESYAYGQPR